MPLLTTPLDGGAANAWMGSSLAAADVNGDGRTDLIVGWGSNFILYEGISYTSSYTNAVARVTVYLGTSTGISSAAATSFSPPNHQRRMSGFQWDGHQWRRLR